jgi:hypothetical protein
MENSLKIKQIDCNFDSNSGKSSAFVILGNNINPYIGYSELYHSKTPLYAVAQATLNAITQQLRVRIGAKIRFSIRIVDEMKPECIQQSIIVVFVDLKINNSLFQLMGFAPVYGENINQAVAIASIKAIKRLTGD